MISLDNLTVSYGGWTLFDNISLLINPKDRIGLVGKNGAGKTTLLRLIVGEQQPTSGSISYNGECTIGYLPQQMRVADTTTLVEETAKAFEEVLRLEAEIEALTREIAERTDYESSDYESLLHRLNEATDHYHILGGDTREADIEKTLLGLGFKRSDFQRATSEFSGGWRMRIELAKLLLRRPSIFLLDEPTNHLDIESIQWLEDYLKNYRGTVFMVTHDRYFLDKVSNRILEISHGKMYSYDSNYSRFLELKAEREEMELASERKRQSILRMELEWAKRGCRARSTKQRARLERLEVLKNGTAPTADAVVEMDAVETRMGKKTIEFHNVSKAFGDKTLMKDFEYIFLRNQSVGIIGPNGCGKSTMLRMITGEVLPDAGTIEIGDTIRIGYLAQEEPDMDTNQRVIDYVKDIAEYVQTRDGRISASQMLERFLFTPDMQYTPISKLSGGEKRRLYLLSVLVSGANVLILDEPSNNVDIPTLTVLEDFLNTFVGIVITVSHDRYFLDNVVDRIFEFDGNGNLLQYEGGYTDYLEAKERRFGGSAEETAKAAPSKTSADEPAKSKNNDWKQKRPTRLKFTFKEQREYETIDDDIAVLEEKIASLDDQMLKNATNSAKLAELMVEKEKTEAALEEKTERWVYLTDLAEQIEAQNQK